MSHHPPDVDLVGSVAHPGDQSVFIMADIEDRAGAVNIRIRFPLSLALKPARGSHAGNLVSRTG